MQNGLESGQTRNTSQTWYLSSWIAKHKTRNVSYCHYLVDYTRPIQHKRSSQRDGVFKVSSGTENCYNFLGQRNKNRDVRILKRLWIYHHCCLCFLRLKAWENATNTLEECIVSELLPQSFTSVMHGMLELTLSWFLRMLNFHQFRPWYDVVSLQTITISLIFVKSELRLDVMNEKLVINQDSQRWWVYSE